MENIIAGSKRSKLEHTVICAVAGVAKTCNQRALNPFPRILVDLEA